MSGSIGQLTEMELPRLRQAVLIARDLDAMVASLQAKLSLGEPYADPGVAHFGLRNAVFALGDTFLEVVSPARPDTSATRFLERRGGDCGYMLMFQVDDLDGARERARFEKVREVFDVSLPDITEAHLHPVDMRGAIVSLSQTSPPESWRWGGPDWKDRAALLRLGGATITVNQPVTVGARWDTILATPLERVGVRIGADEFERGLEEIILVADEPDRWPRPAPGKALVIGGVRFLFEHWEQDEQEE
jgi:hypothetical protein